MLKNLNIALLLILLLVTVACEDNQPVELVDETTGEEDTELEVNVLGLEADTTGTALAADTTGLISSESSRFAASMIVTGVQFDFPGEHHEVSFAHAIFLDLRDPVWLMGRVIGFKSLDLGRMFLDGLQLHRTPYRIRRNIPPLADSLAGVRYGLLNVDGQGDSNFQYVPHHAYTWTIEGKTRIEPQSVLIKSPGRVNIVSPRPETSLSKDHSLEIVWTDERPQTMIISGLNTGTGEGARPLLRIRIPKRIPRIIIPAKVMRLLPTDRFEMFQFTFEASIQREILIPGYLDKILLRVASVHNVLVRIR